MQSQILLIGGSDSSGEAGVQADKSICEHYSLKPHIVTTSITIQDSLHFYNRFDQDESFVAESILKILENNQISVVKIGMLANKRICQKVYQIFKDRNIKIVLDPVFASSSGGVLLDFDAIEYLKQYLLSICYAVTPNISEAEILTNSKISNFDSVVNACKLIRNFDVKNVIVKGGHLDQDENATDVMLDQDNKLHVEETSRLATKVRGSGCRFATAYACNILFGKENVESFANSKRYITSFFNDSEKKIA
jgi:hydroxymethylpyrimidine/phosphomethylpyrimidine kinase